MEMYHDAKNPYLVLAHLDTDEDTELISYSRYVHERKDLAKTYYQCMVNMKYERAIRENRPHLMTIPIELRLMIYDYLFGEPLQKHPGGRVKGRVLDEMFPGNGRLIALPERKVRMKLEDWDKEIEQARDEEYNIFIDKTCDFTSIASRIIPPLSQVSRQLRNEVLPEFYRKKPLKIAFDRVLDTEMDSFRHAMAFVNNQKVWGLRLQKFTIPIGDRSFLADSPILPFWKSRITLAHLRKIVHLKLNLAALDRSVPTLYRGGLRGGGNTEAELARFRSIMEVIFTDRIWPRYVSCPSWVEMRLRRGLKDNGIDCDEDSDKENKICLCGCGTKRLYLG